MEESQFSAEIRKQTGGFVLAHVVMSCLSHREAYYIGKAVVAYTMKSTKSYILHMGYLSHPSTMCGMVPFVGVMIHAAMDTVGTAVAGLLFVLGGEVV